ncbi:hypothetical protein RJ55_07436 [Drechmeria coniospora]|nr:hypothetical protein RJ55_07436 [Drechmeria coniospora]
MLSTGETPAALNLPNRHPITFESATRKDFNVIKRVELASETHRFCQALRRHENDMVAVAKHHLRLSHRDTCEVQEEWITGGFNVCIPIRVTGSLHRRLLLRCPLPHMHAEPYYPGTVDENVRSEIGAYMWMQEHCPDIRTPHLYGFGLSGNLDFTHGSRLGFFARLWQRVRRFFHRIVRYPAPTCLVPNPLKHGLPASYILMEHAGSDVGQKLSDTWQQHRHDPARLGTLVRSLARITIALSRMPQPKIGSFRFNDDGTISLSSRPLTCSTMILESEGTPRTIETTETLTCVEAFVADMIRLHDNRLLSNPSATDEVDDCRSQMAIRALLRTMTGHFVQKESRNGPFCVQLTDVHPGNILVDDNWNVTCIFDLGEMCSLPREMVSVPYWLTGCSISQLHGERLAEFDVVRRQFMRTVDEEEDGSCLSKTMHETWDSQAVWFWHSLTSVDAAFWLVADHLCPKFQARLSQEVEQSFSQFWCENADQAVKAKLEEYERYGNELWQLFGG